MSTFFSMLKVQMNLNFGISNFIQTYKKDKKSRWKYYLFPFLFILALAPTFGILTYMLLQFYIGGKALNQPEIVLTVSFIAAMFFTLLFGIFYIMSALYFSKDIEMLLPLPVRPWEVIASKFIVVVANEYLTILPFLLPAFIIYGIGEKVSFWFIIKSIIVFLFVPFIPLAIAAFFTIFIMRFVNFRKSKDVLAVLGGILGIFIGLGINFYLQRVDYENPEIMQKILLSQRGLVEYIGRKFPPGIWSTNALTLAVPNDLIYILYLIGASLIFMIILSFIGNGLFYRSYSAGQETHAKRKKFTSEEFQKQTSTINTPAKAIFLRELKILLRVPVFALNGLAGIVMVPVMSIFSIFFAPRTNDPELSTAIELLKTKSDSLVIVLIIIGISVLAASLNFVASTSVSREGSSFWISKIVPVSAQEQLKGKFLNGFWPPAILCVFNAVFFAFFASMPFINALIALSYSLVASAAFTYISMIPDVVKPKLKWNNPQEAIKQNTNAVIIMFVIMAIIIALVVGIVYAYSIQLDERIIIAALGGVLLLIFFLARYFLFDIAVEKYKTLEF